MGTLNKIVNDIKLRFNRRISRIIAKEEYTPAEKIKTPELIKYDKPGLPWWMTMYTSKTRPKLTRLQPLKTFGNFSPLRKIGK